MVELLSTAARPPYFILNGSEARATRQQHVDGFKLFEGRGLPPPDKLWVSISQISPTELRDKRKVWRAEETKEAAIAFFKQGRLMVVGGPQEGKGTILFGLSEMCELIPPDGVGYLFIDGHHQEVSGEKVVQMIKLAEKLNIPIFFDSFDYLALGSRKAGRKIAKDVQKARNNIILPAVAEASVPIAITAHSNDWAQEFLDAELREQMLKQVGDFPIYEIPLYIQSPASVTRFLVDHGVDQRLARYIAGLPDSEEVRLILSQTFHTTEIANFLSNLRRYPILKDMVRGSRQEFTEILRDDNVVVDTDRFELTPNGLLELIQLINKIKEKTQTLVYLRRYKKV